MKTAKGFIACLLAGAACGGTGGSGRDPGSGATGDLPGNRDVPGEEVPGETPPPAECAVDQDCDFLALIRLGHVDPGTCRSDGDCTSPDRPSCLADPGWCGCRDDLDCSPPKGCHPVTRRCENPCQSSAWCGSGRECIQGYCTDRWGCNCQGKCIPAACQDDDQCPSDRYCDPCTRTCEPKKRPCQACDRDAECRGDQARCLQEFEWQGSPVRFPGKVCAPWCPLASGICAVEDAAQGAFVCARIPGSDAGACIPSTMDCTQVTPACTRDEECPDPSRPKCWPDRRVCGCRDAFSCPFGQICHPVTHQCTGGCTEDAQCGQDKVCSAGLCREACRWTVDDRLVGCDDPPPVEGKEWDCDKNGHCFIPGMCFGPKDCPEPETHCDAGSRECRPGCLMDFDCKAGSKICDTVTGRCIDRPCTGNFECSCGQVCQAGACEVAQGRYCDPCDQQQGETACGSKEVLCIGLQDEEGKDRGSYCLPPCGPDPANPCPNGWTCEEITDTEGKSHGRKCFRWCFAPVAGGCAIGNPPEPDAASTPDP